MTTATDLRRQNLLTRLAWAKDSEQCELLELIDRPCVQVHTFDNFCAACKRQAAIADALEALSSSVSSETPPVSEDVEKCWQEFWAPIVAPNGVLNLNQVKLELADFSLVIGDVSVVYDHVTGGRISKPTTLARHVIAAADDVANDACAEAVKEAREEWEGGGVVGSASSETQDERPSWEQVAQFAENNATAIRGMAQRFVASPQMGQLAGVRAETLEEFARACRRKIVEPPVEGDA